VTAASWVIAGVTFFALGVILTALLRSDAGKNPFPLAEMLAWSQMQLGTGAQCARQLVSQTDLSPLIELRLSSSHWHLFKGEDKRFAPVHRNRYSAVQAPLNAPAPLHNAPSNSECRPSTKACDASMRPL
jgi:hypothetical protein